MSVLLADVFDNFFAMDNSFLSQMKTMLLDPKKIVHDYWDGYRRFYFSPLRFLLIATIFVGFNFLITKNEFLGLNISSGNTFVGLSLVVFVAFIPFLTFSTLLTYIKFKKNFYEHLVLNIYTFSFWVILFSLVSIVFHEIGLVQNIEASFLVFLLLVIIWNSRVLSLSLLKQILYCILNCVILVIIALGFAFLKGSLYF